MCTILPAELNEGGDDRLIAVPVHSARTSHYPYHAKKILVGKFLYAISEVFYTIL